MSRVKARLFRSSERRAPSRKHARRPRSQPFEIPLTPSKVTGSIRLWTFAGGLDGGLTVTYGEGEDEGGGWEGKLSDADITQDGDT
jgi:hypothetical protein